MDSALSRCGHRPALPGKMPILDSVRAVHPLSKNPWTSPKAEIYLLSNTSNHLSGGGDNDAAAAES